MIAKNDLQQLREIAETKLTNFYVDEALVSVAQLTAYELLGTKAATLSKGVLGATIRALLVSFVTGTEMSAELILSEVREGSKM